MQKSQQDALISMQNCYFKELLTCQTSKAKLQRKTKPKNFPNDDDEEEEEGDESEEEEEEQEEEEEEQEEEEEEEEDHEKRRPDSLAP